MATLARVGLALIALIVAVSVGVVVTFAHGGSAPWLLIAGLALVGALVLGARLAVDDPLVTAATAAGAVGAVIVLALQPGDGIVIVPADGLGLTWLIGAPLVSVGAALWPIRRRPETASESP